MTQVPLFVGVDVSKDRLDAFVHPDVHPDGGAFAVPNTPTGHRDLVERLAALEALECVCLEATGGYERAALRALSGAGLPTRLAQPDEVRAFARAMRLKAKTDRLDAALIARFAATIYSVPPLT